jgi:hypothetical protein
MRACCRTQVRRTDGCGALRPKTRPADECYGRIEQILLPE